MSEATKAARPSPGLIPSFSDPKVFIVPHTEAIPGRPLDYIGHDQTAEGPTYIRVGIGLSDEQLRKVWAQRRRFPALQLEQLRMVRDREVEQLQLC